MDIEEKIVPVSRGGLPCLTTGKGPHLLFLHGAVATPRAYIPLLTQLGRHFTVIAPTHPGHGDAFALPKRWTIDDFVQTYQDILHALTVNPEVIVGHSFGGTLSLLLARVGIGKQIVAMDPPGLPFLLTASAYLAAKAKEARELLAESSDRQRVVQTLSAAATLLYTARKHPENIPWLSRRIPKMDISGILTHITQPVSLLWGEDDGIVPFAIGKKMKDMLPNATFTLFPNKGHTYPVIDPEFTYRAIMNVLRDNDANIRMSTNDTNKKI